jgi:hypothetical protein
VLAYHRRDPGVEQADQAVDQVRPDARIALRQRGRSQQHHGPDRLWLDVGAHRRGMGPDQPDLQGSPLVRRDVALSESPEAGGQAVHGPLGADQGGRDGVRPADRLDGLLADSDAPPEAGDPDDVVDGQARRVEYDGIGHISRSRPPRRRHPPRHQA